MTNELKEQFESIRQEVIDEIYEGTRPVLKKLREISTNELEMKCMEKAYNLDREEW